MSTILDKIKAYKLEEIKAATNVTEYSFVIGRSLEASRPKGLKA